MRFVKNYLQIKKIDSKEVRRLFHKSQAKTLWNNVKQTKNVLTNHGRVDRNGVFLQCMDCVLLCQEVKHFYLQILNLSIWKYSVIRLSLNKPYSWSYPPQTVGCNMISEKSVVFLATRLRSIRYWLNNPEIEINIKRLR